MIDVKKRMVSYCERIVNGKEVACLANIWACQRFLNDLNQEEFPYYFDVDEVYRFYKWSNMFRHSKGVLVGKKIELVDILLFECGNILGWKNKKTNHRRFKTAYISKARKNVKTQLMALISSYIAFVQSGKEIHEVYIAGWDKEQSNLCYSEIKTQFEGCNFLKGKYTDSYGRITHKKSGSVIRALSREAKNTGDGYNPTVGIIDEYHAHKTSEIYDVLASGVMARSEPLMIIITTAGFNLNCPCYKEYLHSKKILNPDLEYYNDDEHFVMICEIDKDDDENDESIWIKANPIVCTYDDGLTNLRTACKNAKMKPENKRKYITKTMNRWVQMKESGYLDVAKWNNCKRNIKISDYKNQKCRVGLDFSNRLDLTAVAFEFYIDGIYIFFAHGFMPQAIYDQRVSDGILPWDLWVEEGWLTVIPGEVINQSFVDAYIMNTINDNELTVEEICYDPWSATQFALNYSEKGFITVEVNQGYKTMSEPTKHFRESVYDGTLIHDGSPLLTFCVSNATETHDAAYNVKLDKDKSEDKIDLLMACIDAHVRTYVPVEREANTKDIIDDYLDQMGWN